MRSFSWPCAAWPVVTACGLYPLRDRGFSVPYRSPTHALHLHDYDGVIRLDGVAHRLRPGSMTFSPADEDSAYDLPRPGMHWCIHVRAATGRSPSGPHAAVPLVRHLGLRRVEAELRFQHLTRLSTSSGHQDPARMRALMAVAAQDLILWFATSDDAASHGGMDGVPSGGGGHPAVDRLIRLILRDLHQPLTVKELSRAAGMSQNYLARLFRRSQGMTIPRFILTRRVETARLLLTSTDLSIKEIAARVGMPDPHHFNKQLRNVTGKSPSALRRGGG